jgi:putative ubiquitin-RnfH superfamily antitoxin RatB of RatAB toxin-antitoxin module
MSRPEEPTVEVAYALPDRQTVIRVKLAERMTALEVYRQLRADPREARRRLASQGRTMGPTGGTPGRG